MRKAIIAAIVATALFAVGAFAASFALSADDVASGSDPVTTCADDVEITFNDDYVTTSKSWEIQSIDVKLTDAAGGTDYPSCVGRDVTLVLQNDTGATPVVYEAELEVASEVGGVATVNFIPLCPGVTGAANPVSPVSIDCAQDSPVSGSWTHLPVASVWNAAVLIDDTELPDFDEIPIS